MADYEYSELSRSEYEKALRTLLSWQVSSKTISKNDAEDILNQAMQQYDVEGWSMNLPLAQETSAGRTKTAWGQQYSKATEDWQRDVIKAQAGFQQDTLQYQKWEQSEAWKRYNAAQQQYGEELKQWGMQNELARLQMQVQQRDEFIRGQGAMGRLAARGQEKYEGESLEEKSRIFKSVQGQLLSGLDPIVDAFQYWTIANKPNKWERAIREGRGEMSAKDRLEKWTGELEKYKGMRKIAKEMEGEAKSDPNRSLSEGEKQYINEADWRYKHAREMLMDAEYESVTGKKSSFAPDAPVWERDPQTGEKIGEPHYGGIAGVGSQSAKRRPWRTPETPPAPEWLAKQFPEATQTLDPTKYALGGTSAVRAIKMKGLTPSAQSWARMLPSEQAGFMSHARWSGGVPADIMGRMESMLPQPSRGARWTPYRR